MTRADLFITIAPFGLIIAGLGAICYVLTNEDREKRKLKALEADFSDEYWAAKKEEARASIEKKRIEEETKERLELDRRDREDVKRREQLEFEKNAPKEYWEAKKAEAHEQTKQVEIKEKELTQRETSRQKTNMEKYTARANSDAIISSAKQVGYAIRGLNALGF